MKEVKRILWVSKHTPLPKQVEELKRIFGDIQLSQYAGFVKDVNHLMELVKVFNADEVVVVLPLTILYNLIKKTGLKPIIAEMEEVSGEQYDYIDEGSGRKYKFKGFARLMDIIFVKEPLGDEK